MDYTLFHWLLGLIQNCADMTRIITQPLIGEFSLLTIFSVTGFTMLITLFVVHLFR